MDKILSIFDLKKPLSVLSMSMGDRRSHLASTAARLLRNLRLVLAREKSYNVSQAEGREKREGKEKKEKEGKKEKDYKERREYQDKKEIKEKVSRTR